MSLDSLAAFGQPLLLVAVGLVIMVAVLGLLGKALPFSMKAAISEKRNDAVSIIIFSVLVGLGIILSASMRSEAEPEGATPVGSASAPAASSAPAKVRPFPRQK
jgi:hypothetical protein